LQIYDKKFSILVLNSLGGRFKDDSVLGRDIG